MDKKFTPCACLGPMYGEPYCACEMRNRGLKLNEEARAAEHAMAKEQWTMGRDGVKRWADTGEACEGCPRCGGEMHPGKAIAQTYTGAPDFPGGDVVTLSPGGPGKLIRCKKCCRCGHSVTSNA